MPRREKCMKKLSTSEMGTKREVLHIPSGTPVSEPLCRVSVIGQRSADFSQLPVRYESLRKKLDRTSPEFIVSRRLAADVLPDLLEMESLLRPPDKELTAGFRAAGLPSWASFVRAYSIQVACTRVEVNNLLREARGLERTSPAAKGIDSRCKEMLSRLLIALELYGDGVPLILVDIGRTIRRVLDGTLGIRDWRKEQQDLDRLRALNSAAGLSPHRAFFQRAAALPK